MSQRGAQPGPAHALHWWVLPAGGRAITHAHAHTHTCTHAHTHAHMLDRAHMRTIIARQAGQTAEETHAHVWVHIHARTHTCIWPLPSRRLRKASLPMTRLFITLPATRTGAAHSASSPLPRPLYCSCAGGTCMGEVPGMAMCGGAWLCARQLVCWECTAVRSTVHCARQLLLFLQPFHGHQKSMRAAAADFLHSA